MSPFLFDPRRLTVLRADGEGEEGGSLFLSHLAAGIPFWGAGKCRTQPASWTSRQPDSREARVRQRR